MCVFHFTYDIMFISEIVQIPAHANPVLVKLCICVLVPLVVHVTLEHAK